MGLFNDLINAVQKPVDSAGTWKNGKFVKNPAPKAPVISSGYGFDVAGIEYRMNDIIRLATPMKKWEMTDEQLLNKYPGKKIYRYYFINEPVQLIPEPTNPHDPNAIKVVIANIHVGYVPASECSNIKQFITSGAFSISAKINGGEYKMVYSDGKSAVFSDPLTITVYLRK